MAQELSVTIITLNEEERLSACLESVTWAHEIIVVDAGSEDKTVEVARSYTDKVIFHPWSGYAEQKNYALSLATRPWVLTLDADEALSPGLHREILEVLERDGPADGYRIPRQNFFLGKWIRHGTWYPDYQLRLFRRGRGQFRVVRVHEAVQVSGTVDSLTHPLVHASYKGIEDFLSRANRYSTLAAQDLAGEGGRWRSGLLVRPWWRFLQIYVLHRGFLEGWRGFVLAALYAFYVFSRSAKVWEQELRERGEIPRDGAP